MDFNTLKKNSEKDFEALQEQIDKMQNPSTAKYEDEKDESYWKPTKDKAGNALAVIRFLPKPKVDGEDGKAFIQYWDYGFQDPTTGKWYIEKSRTTIGERDPVSEFNTMLWGDQGNKDEKYRLLERNQARRQKRRLHYVANIYVVSDPANPENEGKVFRYEFGQKIMDKINKMMKPDLPTEPKVDPTNLFNGANFKLKITKGPTVDIAGKKVIMPSYDEAKFLEPGPLLDDEKELKRIWESEYSLKEIVDPSKFKSWDKLKERLEAVVGYEIDFKNPAKTFSKTVTTRKDEEESPPWKEEETSSVTDDDEDDRDLAEFKRLLEE